MKIWSKLYSINGTANSNNKDIPPTHTEWAKSSIINANEEVEENKLSFAALGLQNDTFDTVYLLTELKRLFTVLLNNWPPWFLPIRCGCLYPYKNLHNCIYKCFFYNYKDSESIKFFFRRWRDKCSVIYPVNTVP